MPKAGYKQTKEHRNKIRQYRLGRKWSYKTRHKMSGSNIIAWRLRRIVSALEESGDK